LIAGAYPKAEFWLRRWRFLGLLNFTGQKTDHSLVLPVTGLQFLDTQGEILVADEHFAQANKGADDHDVHLYSALASKNGGEHGNAVLRKYVRRVFAVTPALRFHIPAACFL
jgi:hypothetical protein